MEQLDPCSSAGASDPCLGARPFEPCDGAEGGTTGIRKTPVEQLIRQVKDRWRSGP